MSDDVFQRINKQLDEFFVLHKRATRASFLIGFMIGFALGVLTIGIVQRLLT